MLGWGSNPHFPDSESGALSSFATQQYVLNKGRGVRAPLTPWLLAEGPFFMVGVVGFEPTASRPPDARSAKLSYTPLFLRCNVSCQIFYCQHAVLLKWSGWLELNQRRLPSEGRTLTRLSYTQLNFGSASRTRTYKPISGGALTVRCVFQFHHCGTIVS